MMRKYWTPIAIALAALPALPTHADQDEQRGPHRRGGEERAFRMQRQEPPALQQMQPPQAPAPFHHGRMSPEERRQLRRDIDAAGRELYQPPPSQRH